MKSVTFYLLSATLALTSFASHGQAQTHLPAGQRILYLSLDGSDANDGLTPTTALRTPQKAADITEPGDVVQFAAGEYVINEGKALLSITRSGAPGKTITYQPAPGAKVVLRNNGAWEAIKITSASYIHIRGFRVIGNAQNITLQEAQREMNNLLNPRTAANCIAIDHDRQSRITPTHITVSDNEVSDCSGGGIYANHADYLTFDNNIVYRNAFWSPYGNSGISVYQPTAVDDFTGYKIFIRNNVAFGNYQNIPFYFSNPKDVAKRVVTDGNGIILDDFLNKQSWGGGSGKPYTGRTLVANNVTFGNGGTGIHTVLSCHVDIVHNYAADNNRHPQLHHGQVFALVSRDIRVFNNVIVAAVDGVVTQNINNPDTVYENNLYAQMDGGSPHIGADQGNNTVGAPGLSLDFKAWENGQRDFSAAADTPIRAKAKPWPAVSTDFFGRLRDKTHPDLGPFVLAAH